MFNAMGSWKFRTLVAICALPLVVAACGSSEGSGQKSSTDKTITIGAILPLTGNAASFGALMKNGAELAASDINAQGGINGKKIKILFEDSAGESRTAVTAMNKIVRQGSVPFVLGSLTDNVLAITPIAEQHKITIINGGGQGSELGGVSPFLFNDIPLASTELSAMAKYAAKELGNTSVVLNSTDEYGTGGAKIWRENFIESGGKVLAEESYATGSTDYRAQLSKLKKSNADMIYFTSYGRDAQLVLKQIKEVGLTAKRIGTTVTVSAGTQAIPEAIDLYHTSLKFSPAGSFVEEYTAKYGSAPDLYASNYYNGVQIFADAYKYAADKGWKLDGESVRKAISEIRTFDTVNGELKFNDENSALTALDIAVIGASGKDKIIGQLGIDDLN